MPDVALIPFAVVGDKWRDEPWWTSGTTLRLLLSEYVKYVAAEVRVRLADAGSISRPSSPISRPDSSRRADRRRLKPTDRFSMVSIFLRSLVYNVLFMRCWCSGY